MLHKHILIPILILATVLVVGTYGIVRAQTTTAGTPAVDTEVTTTAADQGGTAASTTATPATQGCAAHQQARLDEMAKLFNMTTADLQKELDSGKPMYQIAVEHGITYDKMKESRLAELKTKLDDMVKVGYLTQTEADQMYQQAQSQPMMGGGFGGHGMHWFK